MTAFVLGAGLGTRLRPLTERRPKPLIPVDNSPLIHYAFDHLITAGVERFVVNTHWCAERYAEFFPDQSYRGIPIAFVQESPEILETGGALWNAREFLQDGTFIVYNGDILSDLPLDLAYANHLASGNEVTLALRSHGENRNVTFDSNTGRILDLRRALRPGLDPAHLFTGIYFVEPQFIERIPAGEKISVVPIFHKMIRKNGQLGGVVCDDGAWFDLGTREEYLSANALITGETNTIDPSAIIGEGAVLDDCVIWANAEVAPGAKLTRCVVTDGARAEGEHFNQDF